MLHGKFFFLTHHPCLMYATVKTTWIQFSSKEFMESTSKLNEGETTLEVDASEIEYISYGGEHHLSLIMQPVDEELSEPYSIFTYRYFFYLWPQLTSLAFHKGKCIGTVVCKMGEHRNTFRGYIAMLVVFKPYRGHGIATELVTRSIRVMMESGCEEECAIFLHNFWKTEVLSKFLISTIYYSVLISLFIPFPSVPIVFYIDP